MNIIFSDVSVATFKELQLLVVGGDGSATQLKMNLSKPPFNLNFGGVLPSGFVINLFDDDIGTVTGAIATQAGVGDVLTLTFTVPPGADADIGPNVLFLYSGLSGGMKFGRIDVANFEKLQFSMFGDGAATTLQVNLANPPFNLNFNGSDPASFDVTGGATATMSGDVLTVTSPRVLGNGEEFGMVLTPRYVSL